VTWNTQTSNFGSSAINAVAYGNGVWVAGGAGGALRTSTDNAVTWNTQTSNFTTSIASLKYGNGVWMAGGFARICLSKDDAVTWTSLSSGVANFVPNFAYGNGTWVAAGTSFPVTITDYKKFYSQIFIGELVVGFANS